MSTALRTSSLFLLALLVAGCSTFGYPTRYPDSRYPDPRRAPDTRRAGAAVHVRVAQDADRYVQVLDRRVRMNQNQERRIHRLLTERAFERVARRSSRDQARYYPFPRRTDDRHNRSWWKSTDRQIERVLDRRQRRVHRDLVRSFERGGYRDRDGDRGRNRGRGHLPGRPGRGR